MIDRAFTKAEARYIPNGPGRTADMAHPTRTGDLVVFSYPPYQFDAATPGTLVARSAFFGQHGYVPDVQDLSATTSTCAPRSSPAATASASGTSRRRTHDRPGADDRLHARRARAAAEPGRGAPRPAEGRRVTHAGAAHRPDRLPRPTRPDDVARSTAVNVTVGGASQLATMFDEEAAQLPGRLAAVRLGRQRRRLAGQLGSAAGHAGDRRRERLGPRRHLVRQPRVRLWHRPPAGSTRRGPTSRSSARTSSTR